MLHFMDSLTLDAPKRTSEGYLITRARSARTGVYQYTGREVDPNNEHGLRDKAIVNVLRDENTVFDKAASLSFVGKPVTDNHPSVSVTSENWKDYARGTVMGAMRDGEYLSFDLLITDAAAIKKIDGGKRQLSNGYAAKLEFGDFKAPDGTACDARQAKILGGNHVALVDAGRAGDECAIKDSNGGKPFAACDANPLAISGISITGTNNMKIMLDGLHVDLTDADAVKAAFDKKDSALADSAKALADAKTSLETVTGEKAALEKQLADAKAANEPAAIDKLVADRAAFVTTAKALKADIVTDGKTNADIRKEIVVAALGDAAPTSDEAIAGAFAVLAKDAKPEGEKVVHIDAAATASVADGAANVAAIRNLRYA